MIGMRSLFKNNNEVAFMVIKDKLFLWFQLAHNIVITFNGSKNVFVVPAFVVPYAF